MSTMNKRSLIVGNWKMHLNTQQASALVHRLQEHVYPYRDVEIVLAPSMLTLQPLSLQIDRRKFRLSAQDAYPLDEGAVTGEVSFAMLGELAHYCIVGHSARRLYFREPNKLVGEKVAAAIRNDISPILCVGETKTERQNGESKRVVHAQLTSALRDLTSKDIEKVVIAYEPVWAISTFDGIVADPVKVEEMVLYIRKQIADLYGKRVSETVRVLYGGSVNEHDAADYLRITGVDGALIGAASLNYKQFSEIVNISHLVNLEKAAR